MTRPNTRGGGERSTPATAVVTLLATATGVLTAALAVGLLLPAVLAAVTGGLLTALCMATRRRTPGGRAIGGVLVVLAAGALGGAIGLVVDPATPEGAWVVAALVPTLCLASFGATATLTGAIGNGSVRSAVPVALLTALPIVATAILFSSPVQSWRGSGLVMRLFAAVFETGGWLLAPDPDRLILGVITTTVLSSLLLGSGLFVLPRLPLELLARPTRRRVRGTLEALRRWLWLALGVVITLGVGVTVGIAASISGLERPVSAVVTSRLLRAVILVGMGVLWVGWLGSTLPAVTRFRHSWPAQWLPAAGGGLLISSLLPVLSARISPLPAASTGTLLVGGAVGLIVAILLLVVVAGALRMLPTRGAGGALTAGALVTGSVFLAFEGVHSAVIVLLIVCGIVAWDVASYGHSMWAELGSGVSSRRPAVAHATATGSVGLVGLTLALGLEAALVRTVTPQAAVAGFLLLTVGYLTSLVILKRRALRRATGLE